MFGQTYTVPNGGWGGGVICLRLNDFAYLKNN